MFAFSILALLESLTWSYAFAITLAVNISNMTPPTLAALLSATIFWIAGIKFFSVKYDS